MPSVKTLVFLDECHKYEHIEYRNAAFLRLVQTVYKKFPNLIILDIPVDDWLVVTPPNDFYESEIEEEWMSMTFPVESDEEDEEDEEGEVDWAQINVCWH